MDDDDDDGDYKSSYLHIYDCCDYDDNDIIINRHHIIFFKFYSSCSRWNVLVWTVEVEDSTSRHHLLDRRYD